MGERTTCEARYIAMGKTLDFRMSGLTMRHSTTISPSHNASARDTSDAAPPKMWALVPCAGNGSRSGAAGPKQYALLEGLPMVQHTLRALAGVQRLAGLLVVVSAGDVFFDTAERPHGVPVWVAHCGGATRAGSVRNGLEALLSHGAQLHDWVLVHDAARCLITPADVNRLIDACQHDAVGGLLALKVADTLKQDLHGRVRATVDRSDKWLAQTPQMFRVEALQSALHAAGDAVTDEASALECVGLSPLLVAGSAHNFKVTYPQDFALAQAVLAMRRHT